MDYENQAMIEDMFNKHQTMRMLRHELLSSPSIVQMIDQSGLDAEFSLDLMSQMILHKRTTVDVLVGLLKRHFDTKPDPVQACADALEKAIEHQLVLYSHAEQRFILRFDVGEDKHKLIRQYMYLPPMTIPPLEVTSNRGSGYVTIRQDSLLLKDNHHDGDICLDAINRANQVAFSINERVVKGIRNKWKNLAKPKEGESFQDYTKRLKAFEVFEKDAFFTLALLVEMGNRFHFTHKYDKRGRMYSQGYYADYQGNDWNKSCIEFTDKQFI